MEVADSNLQNLMQNFYRHCPSAGLFSLTSENAIVTKMEHPVQVSVDLSLFRLYEINDLQNTMSLFVVMVLTWQYSLCQRFNFQLFKENNTKDYEQISNEFFFLSRIDVQWTPKLVHLNAYRDSNPMEKYEK